MIHNYIYSIIKHFPAQMKRILIPMMIMHMNMTIFKIPIKIQIILGTNHLILIYIFVYYPPVNIKKEKKSHALTVKETLDIYSNGMDLQKNFLYTILFNFKCSTMREKKILPNSYSKIIQEMKVLYSYIHININKNILIMMGKKYLRSN